MISRSLPSNAIRSPRRLPDELQDSLVEAPVHAPEDLALFRRQAFEIVERRDGVALARGRR